MKLNLPRGRLLGSLVLISTINPHVADACGILVHNEVFRRAQHLFSLPSTSPAYEHSRKFLNGIIGSPESVPAIQAGAFFPDWGYSCLWSDERSEAAHWPPFQKAWIDYIHEKYGKINPEQTSFAALDEHEKAHVGTLISFGFAMSSHQVSDVTWHSLHLSSGLMKAIAMNDFNGNLADAHKVLDEGGDAIFATRFTVPNGTSWISPSWTIPIDDLVAVYDRIGLRVSAAKLRLCTLRGLAALKTELSIGSKLYNTYAEKSPTLVTELDSYYLGGVEEMTSSTAYCWTNLTQWYVHGTPSDVEGNGPWDLCDVFRAIRPRRTFERRGLVYNHISSIIRLAETSAAGPTVEELEIATKDIKLIKRDKFGVETYEYPNFKTDTEPLSKRYLPYSDTGMPEFRKEPTVISTYIPYSQFGHGMTAGLIGPIPGEPYIAVTAPLEAESSYDPNAGGVYVIAYSQLVERIPAIGQLHSHQTEKAALLHPLCSRSTGAASPPPTSDTRFGHALTTWAPGNGDPNTYLAISSPGPQLFSYQTPYTRFPAGKIDIFQGWEKVQTMWALGAPLGGRGVKWWGETLASGRLLGDEGSELVVGSPKSDGKGPPPKGCPRWYFRPQEGFVQVIKSFGSSKTAEERLTPLKEKRDNIRIVVQTNSSGPTTNNQDEFASWTIHPPPPITPPQDPCAILPAPRFGSALAVTPRSKTLLVGAPGINKIFAYKFDNSINDFKLMYTISPPQTQQTETTGVKGRLEFGHAIVVGTTRSGEEWVAVSAPGEQGGKGMVRVYRFVRNGDGEKVEMMVEMVDGDGERFARFGRTLRVGGKGLWVGSGFAAEERGVVWWVDVEELVARGKVIEEVKVRRIFVGPEGKAQFGESIYSADINGDGVEDLVVGMPHAGTEGVDGSRLTGAIAMYIGEAKREGKNEEL
ncbi:hypothetical protein BDZ91DRAFT_722759 [Kalaharituber pfeilii]|nr:hypothetical protein BDZ91DRAFT_722759 [Kalaharituber pfeilii]